MVIVQTFNWRYELFREVLKIVFQISTKTGQFRSIEHFTWTGNHIQCDQFSLTVALVKLRPSPPILRSPDQFVAFVLRFNKLQPKQLHFAHNETSSRAHAIPPCICFVRHSSSVETFVCSANSSQSRSIFVCICHVRNHIFHLHFFSLFVSICCAYRAKKTGIFSTLQRLWSFFVFFFFSFLFFSISNYKTCVSIDKSMGRRTNRERKWKKDRRRKNNHLKTKCSFSFKPYLMMMTVCCVDVQWTCGLLCRADASAYCSMPAWKRGTTYRVSARSTVYLAQVKKV